MPPFYSLFRLFITLACFFSFPFNFYGQPAIFGRLSTETGRAGLEFNQFDSPPYTSSVAPSSWYLRRVETHDGKFSIVLNYAAENYSYLSLASYTYTNVNGGSSAASTGLVGIAPPYKYANRSNITGWRLTSITSPTETVTFTANTDRTDLDQCFSVQPNSPPPKKHWTQLR
jgi:hypothetical protein